ncbi:MAG: tetratricopeptide repeat protein [Anaerolineae bacterium]|jgi:tetratricopeptide (TPR) repeat protein|nr:tetratricopeptide repeat protein [Anaerolineae bacterium]
MMVLKANELQEQGVKLYDQHDYEAAARLFQQAKEAYAEASQHDMVAEMKVNIGLVHRALGENQQALELMQEAQRAFQEAGDKLRLAQVLGNMGGVYLALSDREQAFHVYRQAADIFLELGEKKLYSETMLAIGSLQVRGGKFFNGAAYYQIGLEGLENLTPAQKLIKRLSALVSALGNR